MKKALSILLCVVMILSMVPMAALAAGEAVAVTVAADKQDANRGETVHFTVTMAPVSTGIGSFSFVLDIPEGLTYVANSAAFDDGVKTSMKVTADNWEEEILKVGVYGLGEGYTSTANTVLLTFDCTVDATAKGAKTVGLTEVDFFDAKNKDLTTAVTSVTITALKGTSYTPASIDVTYGELAITDKSAKSVTPTLTGKDTEGDDLPQSDLNKVTFAFKGTAPAGLSIDAASGKVTVTDATKVEAGTVTVTATLTSAITKDAAITVTKAASAADTVVISGPDTLLIPSAEGDPAATAAYSAKVYDQYGAEMASDTATITATVGDTGATFENGTLTVAHGAKGGEVTITAASGTDSTKTASKKVLVTDIAFEGVEAGITASNGTYGDKLSDMVKIDSSKLTAKAGQAVAGTYTLVDADSVPNAGEGVAYQVVFNSTDGTYKNVEVKSGTVDVAKKTVTITVRDVTVKKGNEMPALTDEAEFGYDVEGLVGDDALTGTASYEFYLIDDDGNVAETATSYSRITSDEIVDYAIQVTGLEAGDNYTVEVEPGTLEIRKKITVSADVVGNRTEPSGSNTTTQPDGTKIATTVADDGTVTAEITLPAGLEKTNVTVKVSGATDDMVAVIVADDGTETPVKFSVATDDGVAMILDRSAKVKIATHDHDFEDTVDHWAEPNVRFVHARDIFNGTSETTFSPDAAMTRSMIATVLYRLDGENKSDVAAAFEDVAEGTWYTDGVAWAAEQGIVKGLSETVFAPDENVTREQLAAMIYRYVGEPAVENDKAFDSYADAENISDWADSAMRWAVLNGIINGKDGRVLDPQGNATRAEVATILQRFISLQVK